MPSVFKELCRIEKAQEHQKKHYDAKHNTNTKLKVGDKVLVKDMKNEGRKGGKLDQLFPGGPYTIVEDLRYRLKDGKGDLKKTAINWHRLKLWLDPDGGRLKPQKVCMHVCMYVCTYTCVCPG